VQVEPEHGLPLIQPTARLRDTIAIVRGLVRDAVVSHRGEVVTIERFELWFPPLRPDSVRGVLPGYNRLLAEAGFGDAVRAIQEAFDRGGREAAAKLVPDELIDAVTLAGTPHACRERLAAFRRAGLALPIVTPTRRRPRCPDAGHGRDPRLRAGGDVTETLSTAR
jgi:alkanesulfonate monooxygenase SsuD/methylene tetrahydromethanopterin reductase-like flavin-dependent oxidoreductase (luciferase family)